MLCEIWAATGFAAFIRSGVPYASTSGLRRHARTTSSGWALRRPTAAALSEIDR